MGSRARKLAAVSVLLMAPVLLVACGGGRNASAAVKPSPRPSATSVPTAPTATPSKPTELLYAVLEAHAQTGQGLLLDNTVAIAGLDGYARAKTTFQPLTPPYVGCLGPTFPPQAYTAAGRVFFIDGKGVVRSLGLDHSVRQAATFPIGPQQEASFAVSPDGKELLGTVVTIPPKPASANACQQNGSGFAPGDWSENVYAAEVGGQARLLLHRTWPQSEPDNLLSLVGWDARGPLATFPAGYGTQGGGPVHDGWYGTVVRVDPSTGQVAQPLGANSCFVTDVAATGGYVCADYDNGIKVFNPDGSLAWSSATPNEGYLVPMLAPDMQHVAAEGPVILGKDGSNVAIGPPAASVNGMGFFCTGWLDAQTLIGDTWSASSPQNQMAIVHLSAPTAIVSLGFSGTFAGVIQSS